MENPTHRIQQKRLGYRILDGVEARIITERLRDVPISAWSPDDVSEEFVASAIARSERQYSPQCAQRANQLFWLDAVTQPLAEQYPCARTRQLVKLLPEPDRTKAEAIVYVKVSYAALPMKRVKNRQPWHARIEDAIDALLDRNEALNYRLQFGIDDVLCEAGIGRNSIERPAAKGYTLRIFDALLRCPAVANVEVPVMMPQQSDKVQ